METKIPCEITLSNAEIRDLLENLQYLEDQETALKNQIRSIACKISKFILGTDAMNLIFPEFDARNSVSLILNQGDDLKDSSSKIIPFPGMNFQGNEFEINLPSTFLPILASPGLSLPEHIPDFRPSLQRDGLILLSWDKRITEKGDLYTAYWVTSVGTPRFYASKPLCLTDFFSARPDHKSYAAEDGIEFYGQEAPEYVVHVAPELMKSNPKHGELRRAHISQLKYQGSEVNFNHKYLLKTERKRTMLPKKNNKGGSRGRAS